MPVPPRADNAFDRARALERLADEHFDILVIGGGITGAGVALDAASRGLRTALVEKDDFASGTSSKSSKMVHGGLRYLQQREIRLVYENLAERQRLLDNAPHLVKPLPFLIPLFGRNGVVSKTVARSYATALWLYDLTGGLRIGKRHRRIDQAQALRHLPTLRTDHLVAGFLYYDARADDARLTLTVLETAALDHGATVANYVAVTGLVRDAKGAVCGARVVPATFGPGPAADELTVSARVVVNASGVWAEEVQRQDAPDPEIAIRPAKGIHVTVPAARVPADVAAVIPVASDRRSIFVVPWPETGLVYIGTTDTDYDGPLDDPACTAEDVDYLLAAVNAVTTSELTAGDVTGVWAGLRPLLVPGDGRRVSERTADMSRRHTVRTSHDGLVTVTGGKLTTYRKMAEDAVDRAVAQLTATGGRDVPRSTTRSLRLHGAGPAGNRAAPDARSSPVLAHLEGRYGTDAPTVLAVADDRPELLEPVVPGLPYLGVEVVFAARCEMAQSLTDVLARRTRASIQDARGAVAAAPAVARLLAEVLDWSEERVVEEVDAFVASVTADLERAGLELSTPSAGEHP